MSPTNLNELYQQVILDHSRKPRNFHVLPEANRTAEGNNPLCGDRYTVFLKLEDGDHPRHQLSRIGLRHFQGLGLHDDR